MTYVVRQAPADSISGKLHQACREITDGLQREATIGSATGNVPSVCPVGMASLGKMLGVRCAWVAVATDDDVLVDDKTLLVVSSDL